MIGALSDARALPGRGPIVLRRHLKPLVLTTLLAMALLAVVGAPVAYVAVLFASQYLPPGSPPVRALEVVEAYRQLGRAGGRCLRESGTVYQPGWGAPDPVFVAQPPERALAATLGGRDLVVERVVVDYRAPHAILLVRRRGSGGQDQVRAITMIAGSGEPVALDLPRGPVVLCFVHVGDWTVVQDQPATAA